MRKQTRLFIATLAVAIASLFVSVAAQVGGNPHSSVISLEPPAG
jgi:hypothetical protein